MGDKHSYSGNVLQMPRLGPLTSYSEERGGQTVDPEIHRRSDIQPQPRMTRPAKVAATETALKTRGEIEAAVCLAIGRFELNYLGRGPAMIRAHLIDDLLVLRLGGMLTLAEQRLIAAVDLAKGRDLVKQVRTHLIETARPMIAAMIEEVTGTQLISLHHDLSTITGEECFIFTLATAPVFRETLKKGL